jgi:hypothetical protein
MAIRSIETSRAGDLIREGSHREEAGPLHSAGRVAVVQERSATLPANFKDVLVDAAAGDEQRVEIGRPALRPCARRSVSWSASANWSVTY